MPLRQDKSINLSSAHLVRPNKTHDCPTCQKETIKEKQTGVRSLIKKIHEKSGHACLDKKCEYQGAPHSHIATAKHDHHNHSHKHEDGHTCSHDHHDHNHNHEHDNAHGHKHSPSKKAYFKPLNEIIQGLNINKRYKNLFSYLSNLSPALVTSTVLESFGAPNILISPLSLGSMHLINRGFKKFERLGLASITSVFAFFAQKSGISKSLIRPFAAAAIFLIERAGLDPHIHANGEKKELHLHEGKEYGLKNLAKQLKKGVSREFLASLFKLEFNVNTVIPAVNFLSKFFKSNLNSIGFSETSAKAISLAAKIVTMSVGLLSLDDFWHYISKTPANNKDVQAITSADTCPVCGMDGLHVCITEASETAGEVGTFSAIKVKSAQAISF